MALEDEIASQGSHMGFLQPNSIFNDVCGELSTLNFEQGARFAQLEDQNVPETDIVSSSLDNKHGEERFKWLYSGGRDGDYVQSFGEELEYNFIYKRPYMGDENDGVQAPKKQCITAPWKSKSKPVPSKHPQSIAAKNRRERISERLKILQDLVPNGTKVDLVTMLEKAISYVKFLQLQVKVLATDELWPVQGGKSPEIAQVKEAMDAILSSQRRTKSTKESSNQ